MTKTIDRRTALALGATAALARPARAQAAEVKIAMLVPLSGPWARQGILERMGAEMAIDDINAAGADLVEDQEHPALVAKLPQTAQVPRGRDVDTPLALDRLDQDRGCLVVECVGNSGEIIIRYIHESRDHRLETDVILGLSRRG